MSKEDKEQDESSKSKSVAEESGCKQAAVPSLRFGLLVAANPVLGPAMCKVD
jgi:hypothetical protein